MGEWLVGRIMQARHGKRLQFELMSAYAPRFNPDEALWNYTNYADRPTSCPTTCDTKAAAPPPRSATNVAGKTYCACYASTQSHTCSKLIALFDSD